MAVLGVSFDSVDDNRAFAEKHAFPYPLLCDTTRAMGLAYHAAESASDAYPRRITYVVDANGRIERAIETQDAGGQAESLLASL